MDKTIEFLRSEVLQAFEVCNSERVINIQACFKELEALEEPTSQWISVEDRIPDNDLIGYTILCGTTSGTCIACVGKNGAFLEEYRGLKLSLKVTHWMELPKAPEEVE